ARYVALLIDVSLPSQLRGPLEVSNIVALSNQSYQIDWTEFESDRKGKETGTRRYRGIATVKLTAPQDEGVIRLNPIGLYLKDF
ncbi:VirB8/TrbF family protein, partial [Rhizobium ruizarguesonis]